MTDAEANEQIAESYLRFTMFEASRVLRKSEALLEAMPRQEDLILYPLLADSRVPESKRAAVDSVFGLLYAHRPEAKRASLKWFRCANGWEQDAFQRSNGEYPHAHLVDHRPLAGLCDTQAGVVWLKAELSGQRLVEVCAHELFHFLQPPKARDEQPANESAAHSFGLNAARLLSPAGGLFFSEERQHHAVPGDSVMMKHGDRQWIRTLARDGGWGWDRVIERFDLFVSSRPSVYQWGKGEPEYEYAETT